MKQLLTSLFLLGLIACNSSADNNSGSADSAVVDPSTWNEVEFPVRGELRNKDQFYVWDMDPEKKTLRKNPLLPSPTLGVDTLIIGLNERYPNIRLEKTNISNDTLYARIDDAAYLTDQMGSYGAEQYIAYAVLNLTAAPGIRYVRLDFAEGSHAAPDVWSRESFAAYRVVE